MDVLTEALNISLIFMLGFDGRNDSTFVRPSEVLFGPTNNEKLHNIIADNLG